MSHGEYSHGQHPATTPDCGPWAVLLRPSAPRRVQVMDNTPPPHLTVPCLTEALCPMESTGHGQHPTTTPVSGLGCPTEALRPTKSTDHGQLSATTPVSGLGCLTEALCLMESTDHGQHSATSPDCGPWAVFSSSFQQ